ncbi:DUF4071 domain-containing protein [Leptospira sp. 201903074]|uniref:TRAFs-binding domain-containing protein n=1 Tax=Leptospira abararensis TaxID=2810036 RepID=UPI001964CF12|nr:TRAFs-binding domain-containing protein [Leptospira abararensis]MBM9547399.1 DUF4071 domain-containing protein [Leptospira abararensis]
MKTCFVIMGYGIKTDYSTGRELDLDKTYKNIIKPVVEESGFECIRADEIRHSGTIDLHMYKLLFEADIVIADLSTSNPNAMYELGVRHGLKPYTTIAIAEKDLKYPFDLNHTVIRQYEHLGKDIGYDEVLRFKDELKQTILEISEKNNVDSPVYTFLQSLKPPELMETLIVENEKKGETLREIIDNGLFLLNEKKDFIKAKEQFAKALEIDNNNSYLIQKLTLSTYKSKIPTEADSLDNALDIIEKLNPSTTTDPETIGLMGAIWKRKFTLSNDIEMLNKSLMYYEKGFYLKNDYYNGINLAFLYNQRAYLSTNKNETTTDNTIAERIRLKVIKLCLDLMNTNFENRNDKYWIYATLQEGYFAIGNLPQSEIYKQHALEFVEGEWQLDSTNHQIEKLKIFLNKK